MFLTHEEVARITGYNPKSKKRIVKALEVMGIPFLVNRLGEPLVREKALENQEKIQPDFSKL